MFPLPGLWWLASKTRINFPSAVSKSHTSFQFTCFDHVLLPLFKNRLLFIVTHYLIFLKQQFSLLGRLEGGERLQERVLRISISPTPSSLFLIGPQAQYYHPIFGDMDIFSIYFNVEGMRLVLRWRGLFLKVIARA